MQEFAQNGLRTLCCAVRDIDPTFYAEWQKRYHLARLPHALLCYSVVFRRSLLMHSVLCYCCSGDKQSVSQYGDLYSPILIAKAITVS